MQKYLEIFESAKKYITDNIVKGISSEDTAVSVNYSLKQLNRIFVLNTGLTVSEYIRLYKLSRALFELKYSDKNIIDIALIFGYESQEGFLRSFKQHFSITPSEYRRTNQPISTDSWHINQFIHQSAHDTLEKGIHRNEVVKSWVIVKPNRIWASARRNIEDLSSNEFYGLCAQEGVMGRTGDVQNVITEGGAYLPSNDNVQLSFGVELEEDYPLELLDGFEIIQITQSAYVVFNSPQYATENHGDVIYSVWNAQKEYNIKEHGMQWNFDEFPIFEEDNDETGYTLWFPVIDICGDNKNIQKNSLY